MPPWALPGLSVPDVARFFLSATSIAQNGKSCTSDYPVIEIHPPIDYLNDYRIAEFKRLLNEDEYSKYTLSALAELCGFSSRTSFFRYFKKTTGITPNEYVQSIGRTSED